MGADAVVQVEDTSILRKANGEELEVSIHIAPIKGQDIRLAGTDLQKGSSVLQKGERLGFSQLGVLAALGQSNVSVFKWIKKYMFFWIIYVLIFNFRQPTAAIFATGNELKEHFQEVKPGQIRDSNRLALINLLKEYHYSCTDYGIVNDE